MRDALQKPPLPSMVDASVPLDSSLEAPHALSDDQVTPTCNVCNDQAARGAPLSRRVLCPLFLRISRLH